jgi:hypothetical protein
MPREARPIRSNNSSIAARSSPTDTTAPVFNSARGRCFLSETEARRNEMLARKHLEDALIGRRHHRLSYVIPRCRRLDFCSPCSCSAVLEAAAHGRKSKKRRAGNTKARLGQAGPLCRSGVVLLVQLTNPLAIRNHFARPTLFPRSNRTREASPLRCRSAEPLDSQWTIVAYPK